MIRLLSAILGALTVVLLVAVPASAQMTEAVLGGSSAWKANGSALSRMAPLWVLISNL